MTDQLTGLGDIDTFFPETYINWAKAPKGNYEFSRQIASFPGTVQEVVLESEERPINLEVQLTFFDHAELKEILVFFAQNKGRWGKFWFPSQIEFFTINGSILEDENEIRVLDNKFTKTYRGHERVYIRKKDGTLLTYKITSVTEGESEIILTTETAVNQTVLQADVEKISLLFLMRFDNDKMTLEHITDSKGNITTSLTEVIKEYP